MSPGQNYSLSGTDFNLAIAQPWALAHTPERIKLGFGQTGFCPANWAVYWSQRAKEDADLAAICSLSPEDKDL